MELNKKKWSIKSMSIALGVSEQGYYKWLKVKEKPYKHEALLADILNIRAEFVENENYGFERIYLELKQKYNYTGGISTVYRVCKENNLLIKKKKRPNALTKEDREAEKSENLINQDFTAYEPNRKWLSDITEIPCSDGKLYLSAILDCYDGAIVGFSIKTNMKKEICIEAFENACRAYRAKGMIFHSDRGSQYTSKGFRNSLIKYNAVQSMSGTGRCYDNARMESFFATLKKEKLYKIKTELMPMNIVKTIVFRYIEIYYNRQRVYTTNQNGCPPLKYREKYYNHLDIVA
jgi:transposase InsO family protein